jgi:toxin FitB
VSLIVLDTDVVSRYRAGRLPTVFARQVASNEICIAFAAAGELWKGALDRRWGGVRRGGLDLWLDETTILPAGLRVGKVWAALTAGAQRRGRPRPLNDSWIAACCIDRGLPLLTLNRRDFVHYAVYDGLVLLGA